MRKSRLFLILAVATIAIAVGCFALGCGKNPTPTPPTPPPPPPVTVELSQNALTLEVQDEATLVATVTGTELLPIWLSSDPSVATVDASGCVSAMGEGACTVTVSVDGQSASCTVTVTPLPVVTLATTTLTLQQGEMAYLGDAVTVTPTVALIWESSHPQVATVIDGIVTAVGTGMAQITVATPKNCVATCYVTVTASTQTPFLLSESGVHLTVGSTHTLTAKTNRALHWSSTNTSVVTVQNGLLTAVGKGFATVKAKDDSGNETLCSVLVSGTDQDLIVDGEVDEWSEGGEARYLGITLQDLADTEREVTVWATLRAEGIYFGGWAIHTTQNSGWSTWYYNTNFEVFVGNAQKWVNTEGCIENTVGVLKTQAYGTAYRTSFELFVPHTTAELTDETYVRIGWAFKNYTELMTVERNGGTSTEKTDWWWPDLHCPNNTAEQWYLYTDGMRASAKQPPLPQGVYYQQNFNDIADGGLPSEWSFDINPTQVAEVSGGRLKLAGDTRNPVVILNYVPEVSDYAVEFDMTLTQSTADDRWTGLVFDYTAGSAYWQAVIRRNGNVNIDRWNIVTAKWEKVNGTNTTVGTIAYNSTLSIRVELRGDVITYYVNGAKQAQTTMQIARGRGKLGFSANKSTVYYDNFVVKAL